MSNIGKFLGQLHKVKKTGTGKWLACCPAHDDKSPSMAISEEADGTVLIKCFAGCGIDEIAGAVGMQLHEFFPDREPDALRKPARIPFNARDVLECIQQDAFLLAIVAADAAKGKTISVADADKAVHAAGRIIAATRMGGVQ